VALTALEIATASLTVLLLLRARRVLDGDTSMPTARPFDLHLVGARETFVSISPENYRFQASDRAFRPACRFLPAARRKTGSPPVSACFGASAS
jgi:hypothetical protein